MVLHLRRSNCCKFDDKSPRTTREHFYHEISDIPWAPITSKRSRELRKRRTGLRLCVIKSVRLSGRRRFQIEVTVTQEIQHRTSVCFFFFFLFRVSMLEKFSSMFARDIKDARKGKRPKLREKSTKSDVNFSNLQSHVFYLSLWKY